MAKHRHSGSFSRTKHATPPASRRYVASPVSTATASTRTAELQAGFEAFERGDYTQAIHAWKRAQADGAPTGLAAVLAEAHFRRALCAANDARRVQDLSEAVQLAKLR